MKRNFTFIELMIAIAILVLCAGCGLTAYEKSAIVQHHAVTRPVMIDYASNRHWHPEMTDSQFDRHTRTILRNLAAYEKVMDTRIKETGTDLEALIGDK